MIKFQRLPTTLAWNFGKYRGPFTPYINTLRRWSHCSQALPRVCSRSNKSPEPIVALLHIKPYTRKSLIEHNFGKFASGGQRAHNAISTPPHGAEALQVSSRHMALPPLALA